MVETLHGEAAVQLFEYFIVFLIPPRFCEGAIVDSDGKPTFNDQSCMCELPRRFRLTIEMQDIDIVDGILVFWNLLNPLVVGRSPAS